MQKLRLMVILCSENIVHLCVAKSQFFERGRKVEDFGFQARSFHEFSRFWALSLRCRAISKGHMTRRAGMHRFIELSSKSNIGGWAVGPPFGFNIFMTWTSVFQ